MTVPDRPRREPLLCAVVLWALAGAWYLLSEAVAAHTLPGYRYTHHYISDLGAGEFQGQAVDSSAATLMNLGFLHQGLLFVLGAGFAARAFPPSRGRSAFLLLALVHGAGITLVALFPSTQEAVGNGTAVFHVVGACMAILGGNAAVIAARFPLRALARARGMRNASLWLGALGLASALMLLVNMAIGRPALLDDGAWERLSVYTFITWQLLTALAVIPVRRPRHPVKRPCGAGGR